MTRTEQRKFVRSLAITIAEKVVSKIESGRIPEEWDGFELRQLLADKFAHESFKMDNTRKKEYNNTVLVNNL